MSKFKGLNENARKMLLRHKRNTLASYIRCIDEAKEHGYNNPEDYIKTATEARFERDYLEWLDNIIEHYG